MNGLLSTEPTPSSFTTYSISSGEAFLQKALLKPRICFRIKRTGMCRNRLFFFKGFNKLVAVEARDDLGARKTTGGFRSSATETGPGGPGGGEEGGEVRGGGGGGGGGGREGVGG